MCFCGWIYPDFASEMNQLFGTDNVQFNRMHTLPPTKIFDVNNDNNK